MGFWSSVGSFVSSAVSAVSSVLGSVVGSIGGVAATLLKVAPFLGPIGQIVSLVATFIGVLKPGDDIEELGEKALQADKKPEDFDTNADYIDYLRNEVTLDQEKFDKASTSDKMARTAVGVSIASKGIEEEKDMEIPVSTWVSMAKLGLEGKAEEIDKILETFKNGDIGDFSDYVDGKLDEKTEIQVGDTLVEMYKELDPSATAETLENTVGNMVKGDTQV